MKSELPFQRRDEFDQELLRRPISDRARPFLQLMFCAANGTPPEGIKGVFLKVPTPQYVMQGDLRSLAQAMNCSVKTVQRAIEDLLLVGIVRKVADTDTNDLTYTLSLKALMAIPEIDLSTSFGRAVAVLSTHDVFESDLEGPEINTETTPVQAPVQRGVQGGVQPPVQPPVQGGVHPHDEHEHAKTHENKTHASCSMQHASFRNSGSESQKAAGDERVEFRAIPPEHVERIVRKRDRALFLKYFADAVHAKFAKDADDDRVRMAGLFHQVIRVGRSDSPGRVIHKSWKNRDDPDPKKRLSLAQIDEEFSRELLAPPPPPPNALPAGAKRTPLINAEDLASGLTATDLQQQQERRAGNLQALRAMSAQS